MDEFARQGGAPDGALSRLLVLEGQPQLPEAPARGRDVSFVILPLLLRPFGPPFEGETEGSPQGHAGPELAVRETLPTLFVLAEEGLSLRFPEVFKRNP